MVGKKITSVKNNFEEQNLLHPDTYLIQNNKIAMTRAYMMHVWFSRFYLSASVE